MSNIIAFPVSAQRTPLRPSAPLALRVGRRVTCHLYGGREGIITTIRGVPSPAEVRALLGGAVLAGARADADIAFPGHGHSSRIPEAILYGPQWTLWDQVAEPAEIAAALAEVAAREEAHRTDHAARELQERETVMRGERFLGPRRPAGATHALVGERHVDVSDSQTDYFASRRDQTLVLAWSKHGRDLFTEMRKAAAHAPETADLATAPVAYEHREKYSMGAGYYLGERRHSGWHVRKIVLCPAAWRDLCRATGQGGYRIPGGAVRIAPPIIPMTPPRPSRHRAGVIPNL